MTVAVIFINTRTAEDEAGYALMAEAMEQFAADQPGYLGIDSVRDESGEGITVSYWSSREDIRAWKDVLEHRAAQARGRAQWYTGYQLRICKVEAEHGFRSH